VLQFVEGLTDRQAADAVRSRLDWKYALSLDLTDPGFAHTVLSEFRTRLLQGGAEQRLLDVALAHAQAHPGLAQRTRPAADRLDACTRRQPHTEAGRSGGRDATTYA
jgi:transposase